MYSMCVFVHLSGELSFYWTRIAEIHVNKCIMRQY